MIRSIAGDKLSDFFSWQSYHRSQFSKFSVRGCGWMWRTCKGPTYLRYLSSCIARKREQQLCALRLVFVKAPIGQTEMMMTLTIRWGRSMTTPGTLMSKGGEARR